MIRLNKDSLEGLKVGAVYLLIKDVNGEIIESSRITFDTTIDFMGNSFQWYTMSVSNAYKKNVVLNNVNLKAVLNTDTSIKLGSFTIIS